MAEIQMFDIGGSFRDGVERGRKRSTLRDFFAPAAGGDRNALARLMQVDPQAAQSAQSMATAGRKDSQERIGQLAGVYAQTQDPAVWRGLRQSLAEAGFPNEMPWEIASDEDRAGSVKFATAIAQQYGGGAGDANTVQSRFVGEDGQIYALMRDSTVKPLGIKADPRTQLRDQPGIAPGIVDLRTGTVAPLAGGVQPAPAAPQPPQRPSDGDPFAGLQASIPGLRITSRTRTPEENARAGGVANSFHLTGQAIDIGSPSPQERQQVNQWAAQNGYEVIDNYADGHVHLEPRGRPQQAQPAQAGVAATRPAVSPAESERLRLAKDANERAAQAARRAEEAAALAKRGNAPAGYRFKLDGSLEPIPGGPKPAGSVATEGERKAAVLLQRLDGSLAQLEAAVRENPSADSPSVVAEIGRSLPFVGEVAANALNTSERQRVEAAQLDILDAALTLGTGAAYTREQLEGYRRSFFPQIGDSAATIQDKTSRLQNVIQAARLAAGRAAPKTQQSGGQRPAQQGWSIQRVAD